MIVQSFIDKWGLVSQEEYLKTGNKRRDPLLTKKQNFWKEKCNVKMIYCVNKNILTVKGVARLLGVRNVAVKGYV